MSPHNWPALTQPPAPPDDEEGAGHDLRRRELGLTDALMARVRRQAVEQLLSLTDDDLLLVLGDVLRERNGGSLIASTGACVPPCAAPVEAQAAGPER